MATAAWSRLRAPPLHSGATDTLFGLPVHGCHVPDLWLTGSAPSLGEAELARADELVVCRNAFSQHDTAGRGEFTTTRLHTES